MPDISNIRSTGLTPIDESPANDGLAPSKRDVTLLPPVSDNYTEVLAAKARDILDAYTSMLGLDARVSGALQIREEDGKVIITANSYDPGLKPKRSFLKNLAGYFDLFSAVRRINKLPREDSSAFDVEFRNAGAQVINTYGLEIEIEGLENIDPSQPYLVAPTHTSEAEFTLLAAVLPQLSLGYLAKDAFKKYPIYGTAMKKYEGERFFFIDRGSKTQARSTVSQITTQLAKEDNSISVVYYAQGTRAEGRVNEKGERIGGDIFEKGPLKLGVFHAALDLEKQGAQVPILPITINGIGEVKPRGSMTIEGQRRVRITIGKPVIAGDYEGTVAERVDSMSRVLDDFYRSTYLAPVSHADAKLTVETMRKARLGPWLIGSLKERILKFWRRNENKVPQITYKDAQGNFDISKLKAAQHQVRAKDYERVGVLFKNLVRQQSAEFNNFLQEMLNQLNEIKKPFVEAFETYVSKRASLSQPDFDSYSAAAGELHQTVVASQLFRDKDSDLRLWAFYTAEAKDKVEKLTAQGAPAEDIKKAQIMYFRLFARGTRYAILNKAQKIVGKDGISRSSFDWMKAAVSRKIPQLRELGEMVELATELLVSEKSVQSALEETKSTLAELAPKYASGIKAIKNKLTRGAMSYSGHRYLTLMHQKKLLEALSNKMGGGVPSFDDIKSLAGVTNVILSAGDESVSFAQLLASNPEVKNAYKKTKQLETAWEGAYKVFFKALIKDEMSLYDLSKTIEYKVHEKDGEFQLRRYEDLINKAEQFKPLTSEQKSAYNQARSDYVTHLEDYVSAAKDMAEGGATKEYKRKTKELDLFFKWLNLHWTVSGILKEIDHPEAGYVRLVSAMFPNQVEFLNRLSSKQFDGLRPIFESMTARVLQGLYFESMVGPNDPRQLERYMALWGLDATRRSVDEVLVVGAQKLAGLFGQSTGADLFAQGASLLTADQVSLGVNPQSMGVSANHQGFSDYTFVVGLMSALGFGRNWVVYEAKNFDPFPVLSPVLAGGDGIAFERDNGGSSSLQAKLELAFHRGVSPTGFDHGTRRMVTTPNPLNNGVYSDFVPREFVLGGSLAEIGESARRAARPYVPTLQIAGRHNHDPDLPLSGNIAKRFTREPYSIHQGAPMGGQALLSHGDVIPGQVLPADKQNLLDLDVGLPADADERAVSKAKRQVIAAHTEIGRLWALVKARAQFEESLGQGKEPVRERLLPEMTAAVEPMNIGSIEADAAEASEFIPTDAVGAGDSILIAAGLGLAGVTGVSGMPRVPGL